MNNSIFDIIKLLSNFNQPQQNTKSASSGYYPQDAYQQTNTQSGIDNNILPLLMSLMGKGGELGKIFSQSNKKEEESKNETSSPKDELLL